MKAIAIAMSVFAVLISAAMYFASHAIDERDREEHTQGCVLEAIAGTASPTQLTAVNGATLVFRGWVAETQSGKVPASLDIVLVDSDHQEVVIGKGAPTIDRPDVVAVFHKPTLLKSGFEIPGNVAVPRTGSWEVRLREHFVGKNVMCYSEKLLRITN